MDIDRPDKKKAPAEWNKSWETDLGHYYSGLKSGFCPPPKASPFLQKTHATKREGHGISFSCGNAGSLQTQKDIRQFALPKLAADDLEEGWYSLDSKRATKWFLRRFVRQ